jgi:hypothetical protein
MEGLHMTKNTVSDGKHEIKVKTLPNVGLTEPLENKD